MTKTGGSMAGGGGVGSHLHDSSSCLGLPQGAGGPGGKESGATTKTKSPGVREAGRVVTTPRLSPRRGDSGLSGG